MSWTDERVEDLKRLWGDGLTAREIARQLGGVTHGAVIGKAYRLGLPRRPKNYRSHSQGALPGQHAERESGSLIVGGHNPFREKFGKSTFLTERLKRMLSLEKDTALPHMPKPSDDLTAEDLRFLQKNLYENTPKKTA